MLFFKVRKTGREIDLGEDLEKRDCRYNIILGLMSWNMWENLVGNV